MTFARRQSDISAPVGAYACCNDAKPLYSLLPMSGNPESEERMDAGYKASEDVNENKIREDEICNGGRGILLRGLWNGYGSRQQTHFEAIQNN
jgi:hypothetical protein